MPLLELALPAMDLLLLALLVAVGSILGVRLDRTLFLVISALVMVLIGDVSLFSMTVQGTYVDGGARELTWLSGIALATPAAAGTRGGSRGANLSNGLAATAPVAACQSPRANGNSYQIKNISNLRLSSATAGTITTSGLWGFCRCFVSSHA